MLKRSKNTPDNKVDIASLNHILRTGKKIINISYFVIIVCLILLGTYLCKELKIFGILKEVLITISPLFIGFIIAWLFEPFVTSLQKNKLPRILGCIIVYVIILSVVAMVGYTVVPTLVYQVQDFVSSAPDIFDDVTNWSLGIIKTIDTNNFINVVALKKNISSYISDFGLSIANDIPKYVVVVSKAFVSGGLNVVLGLMVGFYILYDFNKIDVFVKKIIPKNWVSNYEELSGRINTSLRSYVQGVLLVMFLVFLTQSIGLTLAGLKAPILFALFCAVTDIIPYFGPYIGGIPAVIVGFTMSPLTGVCVLISILVVQALENNFYQPLIMGHTMKLHPVTIMIGLLIFQHFFGIIGMVVATPCIACLKVLVQFIDEKTGFLGFAEKAKKETKAES